MDELTLGRTIDIITTTVKAGEVFALFRWNVAGSYPRLWRGDLTSLPDLMTANGGPFDDTPTNVWPMDREWFLFMDQDLMAAKLSGPKHLIDNIRRDPVLETIEWPA